MGLGLSGRGSRDNWGRAYLHAQPTHRKKTTIAFRPLFPSTNFLSRSSGATAPTPGQSAATGIGGGAGVSQGWTVRGRLLTVIHFGQLFPSISSSSSVVRLFWFFFSFLGSSLAPPKDEPMFMASLGTPSFLSASLVPRLENIVCGLGLRRGQRSLYQGKQLIN